MERIPPKTFWLLVGLFSLVAFGVVWTLLSSSFGRHASSELTDLVKAGKTLSLYYDLLADKNYGLALFLHGSGFETLERWNPQGDFQNREELLRLGCEQNGWRCMRIGEIVEAKEIDPKTFSFLVRFRNEDGTFFVQGACCGEETTEPPIERFEQVVRKEGEDLFYVVTEPVYTP